MLDENGVTEYKYDNMGRLTWISDYSGEDVSYEYDERGRKSKVTYPDGKYVTCSSSTTYRVNYGTRTFYEVGDWLDGYKRMNDLAFGLRNLQVQLMHMPF